MKLGYARASTSYKSLGAQIIALKAYGCEEIVHHKIIEKHKDACDKLLEKLDTLAKSDVLVVTKLHRLASSPSELNLIIKKLKDKHIDLKVLDRKIDTTVGNRDLVFNTIVAVVDCDNALVREHKRNARKSFDSEYDSWLQSEAEVYVREIYEKNGKYPCLENVAQYLKSNLSIERQSTSDKALELTSIMRRIRATWKKWPRN